MDIWIGIMSAYLTLRLLKLALTIYRCAKRKPVFSEQIDRILDPVCGISDFYLPLLPILALAAHGMEETEPIGAYAIVLSIFCAVYLLRECVMGYCHRSDRRIGVWGDVNLKSAAVKQPSFDCVRQKSMFIGKDDTDTVNTLASATVFSTKSAVRTLLGQIGMSALIVVLFVLGGILPKLVAAQ